MSKSKMVRNESLRIADYEKLNNLNILGISYLA